ncbi:MAG TPA: carboxylating nicotinate-nucleotide diphosphorylase [Propionibacteriaceae bacterium]|nr:carboxylating nicotinate-nucleotide diphosphorylase [Propionibacteriaceae bacterium]
MTSTLFSDVDDRLTSAGLDPQQVRALARATLAEDLQWGPDVTSEATLPDAAATAEIVSRATGCLAGGPVAAAVFEELAAQRGETIEVEIVLADGERVRPGDVVLRVTGRLRTLLTAERSALNLACQLSGVATQTRAWADALEGSGARVRDSRKTVPGLRVLQKYAVRCGGGVNHRMGLGDAALIKDNHVAAAGSVGAAFRAVRERRPDIAVEVECDTLDQVREAVGAGASLILLDNMTPDVMREAVAVCAPRGVRTEASGGLTLATVDEVAATGVDYISVGGLTHSAPALDLGMDLR